MPFPSLPSTSGSSSSQVSQAHAALSCIFDNATQALHTRSDSSRIRYHQNVINHDVIPILHALENMAKQGELSLEWVLECSAHFGTLLLHLIDAHQTAIGK